MTRTGNSASPRGEAFLVVEIEDGAICPKKLLGDLMAIHEVAQSKTLAVRYADASPRILLLEDECKRM